MSGPDRPMRSRRGPREEAVLDRVRELRTQGTSDGVDVVDAWYEVLRDLSLLPISDVVRQAYEEVLATFPTAVAMWQRYVGAEMAANNTTAVKQLFGRCLMSCPSIDLWTLYLKFVKRSNENKGAAGLLEVRQAYEFTLEVLGHDVASGPIWNEYLSFLQAPKPGTEAFTVLYPSTLPGQEEAARAVVVRRWYQRAVVVPTHYLDALYRQYEVFEGAGNKKLSKKVLEEWKPRYLAARQAYRERRRKLELLNMAVLPMEPGKGGLLQSNQLAMWQEYVRWEASNPQRLESAALVQRVNLAYDQMLIGFAAYPEVWYEYARWHMDGGGGGHAAAAAVLAKAVTALPGCVMLRFALADAEEVAGRMEEAKDVMEGLAATLEAEAAAANPSPQDGAETAPPAAPETISRDQGALAWVQYMRYLRRTGDTMGSRQLFLRARKWALSPHFLRVPWQVYAAAALLEWQVGRDSAVAAKIFEKGLDEPRLLREPDYVLQYHRFLCDIGDTDNARALFDRAFSEPDNLRSALLWQRYVQFEYELGNVAAAWQVERRAKEALGRDAPSDALAMALLKFQFQGTWPGTDTQRRNWEHLLGLAPAVSPLVSLFTQASEPLLLGYTIEPSDELRRFQGQLAELLDRLPPATAFEGAPVPAEDVLEALMSFDLSPSSITRACFDLEAGLHPMGIPLGLQDLPRGPPAADGPPGGWNGGGGGGAPLPFDRRGPPGPFGGPDDMGGPPRGPKRGREEMEDGYGGGGGGGMFRDPYGPLPPGAGRWDGPPGPGGAPFDDPYGPPPPHLWGPGPGEPYPDDPYGPPPGHGHPGGDPRWDGPPGHDPYGYGPGPGPGPDEGFEGYGPPPMGPMERAPPPPRDFRRGGPPPPRDRRDRDWERGDPRDRDRDPRDRGDPRDGSRGDRDPRGDPRDREWDPRDRDRDVRDRGEARERDPRDRERDRA